MRSLHCVCMLATLSALASVPAVAKADCSPLYGVGTASCGDTVRSQVYGQTSMGFNFTLEEAQELTFLTDLSTSTYVCRLEILAEDCSVVLDPVVPNESGVLFCKVPLPAGSYVANALANGDRYQLAALTMLCGNDDCDQVDVAVEESSWSNIKQLFQ